MRAHLCRPSGARRVILEAIQALRAPLRVALAPGYLLDAPAALNPRGAFGATLMAPSALNPHGTFGAAKNDTQESVETS